MKDKKKFIWTNSIIIVIVVALSTDIVNGYLGLTVAYFGLAYMIYALYRPGAQWFKDEELPFEVEDTEIEETSNGNQHSREL